MDKAQAEKNKLDQVLRSLNEEVVHQDEVLSKLNREKKYIVESSNKSNEELATQQDKFGHLNDVRSKLEKTLDQMDSAVEGEKRIKSGVEKERRRLEGELKMCQVCMRISSILRLVLLLMFLILFFFSCFFTFSDTGTMISLCYFSNSDEEFFCRKSPVIHTNNIY